MDGPSTGVARQIMPLKRVTLTNLKLKVSHGARTGTVKKIWTESKAQEQWDQSAWAKKIAQRATRASLGDFDRFKAFLLKKKVCMPFLGCCVV